MGFGSALWIDPVFKAFCVDLLLLSRASCNDFQSAQQQAGLFIICCHARALSKLQFGIQPFGVS